MEHGADASTDSRHHHNLSPIIVVSKRNSREELEESDRITEGEENTDSYRLRIKVDSPPLAVVAGSSLSPPPISRSASASSLSARRRVSSLGTTGSNDDLLAGPTVAPLRMRHQSSPLTSPTFQHVKTFDVGSSTPISSSSSPTATSNLSGAMGASVPNVSRGVEYPALDLGHSTFDPVRNVGVMGFRRNAATQRRRLLGFGTIVVSLSSLLWFSVYQRHSIWGSPEVMGTRVPVAERGAWIIVALVMSFLGFAAICAGVAIKREEGQTRIRVVTGDAVLGMIAEQGDLDSSKMEYTEPTTPQRQWAIKAISEMSDRV